MGFPGPQSKEYWQIPDQSPNITPQEDDELRRKAALLILDASANTGKKLSTDIDNPNQFYDYRSAIMQGAAPTPNPDPDQNYHWPSEFKADNHPNRIVNGFDTKTGEPTK